MMQLIQYRRLKALIHKESLQIFRDPSSILISVFLPLLLLFLYGYGVSLDLDHLRVGLVMEDTSPDAQNFAKTLFDSRYFDVEVSRERSSLYKKLEKGELRGILVIPSYFSQFRQDPNLIAPIQVIADGGETNTANFVQYYAQGAFQTFLAQETINAAPETSLIHTSPRFWYNEQLESRYFLLSGSLAIIMTLIGALLTALVVAREWERGTMEALISTEVSKAELILSKVIPYFILGLVSMTICTLVSTLYYQLPFRGSFLSLLFSSSSFLLGTLGLGLMVSTLSKVQVIASQITLMIAFLPAYVLSGFLFDIASMPLFIRSLTYLMPARYFVQNLQTLFLVGDIWQLTLYNNLIMLFFAAVVFLITVKVTKKRLT